jgi:hypothetical protein
MAQINIKTDLQRKSDFLNPLIIGISGLLLFGILIVVLVEPTWRDLIIMGTSLSLNLLIFFLNRHGYIQLATHLFCYNFNGLIFIYVAVNLFQENDVNTANQLTYVMTLAVLLAGLLLDIKTVFWFGAVNSGLIFTVYLIDTTSIGQTLILTFPPLSFLGLLIIIAWTYQRSLNRAFDRLNIAQKAIIKNQLLQQEMEIARDLQQRLYPAPPSLRGDVHIAINMQPARETSGDFYDFIQLSPDDWGIVVADVTGKSLAAAMVMTMTRSVLRSEAQRTFSPAAMLAQTNRILCDDASVDQMVTTFYGIFNSQTLTLDFSNAGHLPPWLKRGNQVLEMHLPGLPLRAFAEAEYAEQRLQLCPGDLLILMTDGIVETMNSHRELFGFERLNQVISRLKNCDAHQAVQEIWQAVETFRGSAQQHDDTSLLIIGIEETQKD